jgi:ectoine hydroxylase-related dioxygenase (phytanoyl-CoA dioxygenase family)
MLAADDKLNSVMAAPAAISRSRAVPDSGSRGRSDIRVSEEQLAAFRRDGFLVLDDLTTPDEIASMRTLYDRLFSERRGWENGDLFDMVGRDSSERPASVPQMLWPSRYWPELRQTQLYASAVSVAEQMLGPGIQNILEHAIMKPALHGGATPWHQDDAFSRKGSGFLESISIWMPLQDVTLENGCLMYIRGSNWGPLYPHRSPNNDPRIHGLETVAKPDMTNLVPVPVRAGGAVIHHSRTLHAAGVNTSDQPRRAYVLGYAVQARPHSRFSRDYPWNLEKRTARDERELSKLPGWKRTLRKVRRFLRGR